MAKLQGNLSVSPEGVIKISKHTMIHGVRIAWARRHREVNGYTDEDPKASVVGDQKML